MLVNSSRNVIWHEQGNVLHESGEHRVKKTTTPQRVKSGFSQRVHAKCSLLEEEGGSRRRRQLILSELLPCKARYENIHIWLVRPKVWCGTSQNLFRDPFIWADNVHLIAHSRDALQQTVEDFSAELYKLGFFWKPSSLEFLHTC